jgi:hypothetical protein
MFRAYLAEFKALCDQHGAELVVVGLPIDVQVDAGEWAKYGVTDPPDMQQSLLLLEDLPPTRGPRHARPRRAPRRCAPPAPAPSSTTTST